VTRTYADPLGRTTQTVEDFSDGGIAAETNKTTEGAVSIPGTLVVRYTYSELARGVNHSRLTSMTYPSGRTNASNYASGTDDSIAARRRACG
jgi:hypothetical protein